MESAEDRDLAPKGHTPPPPPPPRQGLKSRGRCQVPLGETLTLRHLFWDAIPSPIVVLQDAQLLPVEEFLCLRQVRF